MWCCVVNTPVTLVTVIVHFLRMAHLCALIFLHVKSFWTQVRARKLRVHKIVTVGANLHRLIYNLVIAIVFSLHILQSVNSKKYQSRAWSTQRV